MSDEEEEVEVEEEEVEVEEEEVEAELTDPQEELRQQCQPKCQQHVTKLEACNARVGTKIQTRETCMEELIDLLECVEHCVGEKLFSMLK